MTQCYQATIIQMYTIVIASHLFFSFFVVVYFKQLQFYLYICPLWKSVSFLLSNSEMYTQALPKLIYESRSCLQSHTAPIKSVLI